MTRISDGVNVTLADLDEENRLLCAENQTLRLLGNEMATVLENLNGVPFGAIAQSAWKWREALRS